MRAKELMFKFWVILSGIIITVITFGLFLYILYKGIGVVTPEFIIGSPKGIPLGTQGGVFPAIMGSILSGLISGILGGVLGQKWYSWNMQKCIPKAYQWKAQMPDVLTRHLA
jgi:phosphate transport system permease protein